VNEPFEERPPGVSSSAVLGSGRGQATVSDQEPHEPDTAYVRVNPVVNAIAGGTILACVVLILVLSLRDTPGSPHGVSLALIVVVGTLSAFATFYLARRGGKPRRRG
jgi:hypothetical protein